MGDNTGSETPDWPTYKAKTVTVIAGRSLDQWREFAKRDDCLDHMVPSDLRLLISAIGRNNA